MEFNWLADRWKFPTNVVTLINDYLFLYLFVIYDYIYMIVMYVIYYFNNAKTVCFTHARARIGTKRVVDEAKKIKKIKYKIHDALITLH